MWVKQASEREREQEGGQAKEGRKKTDGVKRGGKSKDVRTLYKHV